MRVSRAQRRAGVRLSAATAATPGPAHPAIRTVHGTDPAQRTGEVGEIVERLIERQLEITMINTDRLGGQNPAGTSRGVHADWGGLSLRARA